MAELSLTQQQKSEFFARLEGALADVPGISFAYVFGSFLTRAFHDVDVAAFFDEPQDAKDLTQLELDLQKRLELPIDLQGLNKAPLAFAYRVIKDGRPVFERDEIARLDYEERISDLYFDFKPYLDRYLEEAVYGRR